MRVPGWGKSLKFITTSLVLYIAALVVVTAMWSAYAQQGGGVFQGGQGFVTLTTASTNCGTIAIQGPHQILEISLQNSAATNMFLHLYDLGAAPAAGSLPGQIGVYGLPGIGGNVLGEFAPTLGPTGKSVANGIGFCITGAMPLADATNGVVGGVVNWTVK